MFGSHAFGTPYFGQGPPGVIVGGPFVDDVIFNSEAYAVASVSSETLSLASVSSETYAIGAVDDEDYLGQG